MADPTFAVGCQAKSLTGASAPFWIRESMAGFSQKAAEARVAQGPIPELRPCHGFRGREDLVKGGRHRHGKVASV